MAMNLIIPIFDGNVEGAVRRLKSTAIKTGLLRELKERAAYMKPSDRRRRKSARSSARRCAGC